MIDQYGERAPGGEIALRVNPGFGHGHSRKTNTGGEGSKHGIWWEDVGDALRRAERHGLRVGTLHMHIGSGVDLEHLALVAGAMERCAGEVGAGIHTISTGGGLPVPYRARRPAHRHRAPLRDLGRGAEAPRGRASATACGSRSSRAATSWRRRAILVTEIRAIKRMGGEHVLPGRRRLQHAGAAGAVRRVPPDVARARPMRRRAPSTTSWWAARSASRATSSRRKRAAWCAPSGCPRRRWASTS